ncbi:hypothetical protein KCP74_15365 [Salmonella enterica subsp. enterica]|nr:hypothetical protein KCP74_15365 [Salmonella enterica subsp. enterica]
MFHPSLVSDQYRAVSVRAVLPTVTSNFSGGNRDTFRCEQKRSVAFRITNGYPSAPPASVPDHRRSLHSVLLMAKHQRTEICGAQISRSPPIVSWRRPPVGIRDDYPLSPCIGI